MPDLHPRTTDLVDRFAVALKEKLAAAEKKYGYTDGWADNAWMDECRERLMEHIAKGDPRDVAAYCAFLWHHGESTAASGVTPTASAYPNACNKRTKGWLCSRMKGHEGECDHTATDGVNALDGGQA